MPSTPAGLTYSTTPIHTTKDGQIIENLDLWVSSGNAITVTNDNVIIRNCIIHHVTGNGVLVDGASNVTVEDSLIVNASPPSGIAGESEATDINNIWVTNSPGFKADYVTLRDGATGIYLGNSPSAVLINIKGYNFHGPFPAGQFVQFYKSDGGTLSDFYALNPADSSRPEDIVSVIDSRNVTIARGVIDGDNSVSGVGVMFEGNSDGGKVDHVDAIHMGDGAFSSYSNNVSFDYTRSFDNIADDQGRGDNLSNTLIWNVSGDGVSITNSTYTHPANPDNIVWEGSSAEVLDVKEAPNASPMSHITNVFDWTTTGGGPDTTAPTVSISISDTVLTVGETALASFAFSEAPIGFALSDAVANGGTLSNLLKVDATHYTALFTPITGIEITDANVGVTAASYTNAAGNPGAAATSSNFAVDTIVGGATNDIYYVDSASDLVKEAAGGGTDTVYASINYTLATGQEIEYLRANAGSTGLTLTGNELANILVGNSGADTLYGGTGNDLLNGSAGSDVMSGGTGSDIYIVDNAGDLVNETAGGGTDTVYASVNYTLAAGQEIEYLRANAGSTGLTLTGNELANILVGNSGADTLYGGTGNDLLNGSAGWDVMSGGTGNDIYIVDNAGDLVKETAGEGTDSVYASVAYTLGAGQEIEYLRANAGSTGLTLTGNELDNTIVGGRGNDTLNGGGGNDLVNGIAGTDVMNGGTGNDIYIVDNAGDLVKETADGGTDTVYASVNCTLGMGQEIEYLRANAGATGLTLGGNELANVLVGNSGGDTLDGAGGNDVLRGGMGVDRLAGGAGADVFAFNAVGESGVTSSTRDVITDFVEGADKIDLSKIDADSGAAGDQAFSFLGTSRFTDDAGQLRAYQSLGQTIVEGDIDGDGVRDFRIQLNGLHVLADGDFAL